MSDEAMSKSRKMIALDKRTIVVYSPTLAADVAEVDRLRALRAPTTATSAGPFEVPQTGDLTGRDG